MVDKKLKGWNYIVYVIINKNFKGRVFDLTELYEFEQYFKIVYPDNAHIKEKLRQTLQNLRNKGLLTFVNKGQYQLIDKEDKKQFEVKSSQEVVYLLSNDSIPGWVKIGRTNSIERRLKELYNTSVPLPFKLEDAIVIESYRDSVELEKSIHSIIDTLNEDLRKNTEAYKREFFLMTPEKGKEIFKLVLKISGIQTKN